MRVAALAVCCSLVPVANNGVGILGSWTQTKAENFLVKSNDILTKSWHISFHAVLYINYRKGGMTANVRHIEAPYVSIFHTGQLCVVVVVGGWSYSIRYNRIWFYESFLPPVESSPIQTKVVANLTKLLSWICLSPFLSRFTTLIVLVSIFHLHSVTVGGSNGALHIYLQSTLSKISLCD